MKAGDRVVDVCRRALAKGPIASNKHRDYYRQFVACGFGQDLSDVKTSCGVFVRAVLHWAGRRASRPGKIGGPVNNGWLEGLTFKHPAWVWNDGKSRPTPGCVFARDYTKETTSLYHVGVFIEQTPDGRWHTAEGGGGNGTECRMSTEPKALDGVDGLNRRILGWWRPEAIGMGADFTPGMPEHEVELFPFPGLDKTSAEFRRELLAVARRLDIDPNALAAIMCVESRFNPKARNPHVDAKGESAVGLIQFMPFLLRHWGITVAEVAAMSSVEQLKLVERFYANAKGVKDPGTLYMLTFLPAAAYEPDNYVLGDEDSAEVRWNLSLRKIYEQNEGLDLNRDGQITVGEVKKLTRTVYAKAKAAVGRPAPRPTLKLGSGLRPEKPSEQVQLVQKAVGAKVDGRFGKDTERAVRRFQESHGLFVDGVVGPQTWATVLEVLGGSNV